MLIIPVLCILGAHWPATPAYLLSSRPVKGASLKKQKQTNHIQQLRSDSTLSSGLRTGVNTHLHLYCVCSAEWQSICPSCVRPYFELPRTSRKEKEAEALKLWRGMDRKRWAVPSSTWEDAGIPAHHTGEVQILARCWQRQEAGLPSYWWVQWPRSLWAPNWR